MRCHNCSAVVSAFSAFTPSKLGLNNGTDFILAILSAKRPAEPTTLRAYAANTSVRIDLVTDVSTASPRRDVRRRLGKIIGRFLIERSS